MIYRQGRHRPRNVYAQHGPKPADDDVFVALFDDPYDAADYCWLKNAQERHQGTTTEALSLSASKRDVMAAHDLMACDGCGHTRADHLANNGRCDAGHCPCGVFQEPVSYAKGFELAVDRRLAAGKATEIDPADFVHAGHFHEVPEPGVNPFCQRDGCIHVRADHMWGSAACRAEGCFCAAFVEVET